LPAWFDTFLTNVCEIPDRNSPEDEPEAIVATPEELRSCALNAIEQCSAANGAIGEREAFYIHRNVLKQLAEGLDFLDARVYAKPPTDHYVAVTRAALTAEKVAAEAVAGEIQAFEAWFKTSGFWNNAITEKAWRAACAWMRESNATMCEEVMEQSRNSLFRSAAKICAGLIRAGRKAQCDLPPEGWYCARDKGHEGPCAAYANEQQPARSAEQDEPCTNCGMSVDPKCACERGRKRAASTQSTATQPAQTQVALTDTDPQLFQRLLHARSELGRTIADPMWADHTEVSKAALKRWHSTIDATIKSGMMPVNMATIDGMRALLREAGGINADQA
jgi:hypothetical protein